MRRFAPVMLLLAATGSADAELAAVWVVDDGTKVSSRSLDHPLESGNLTFDGSSIRLLSARNETVAFQVIVEGGESETVDVGLTLDSIGPIRNATAPMSPDRYYSGRAIEIWAAHYVTIRERSHDLYWKRGTASEPQLSPGAIPDALLPVPDTGISVPRRENRGFWVDVYVPRSIEPGTYRGELAVTLDGQPCRLATCSLEVHLEVIDAMLPDRPTAGTMLWFSGDDRERVLSRYVEAPDSISEQQAESLRRRHFHLARRNRITLFSGKHDAPNDELADLLSGDAFSEQAGYWGPGVGMPQDLYVIHAYGDRVLPPDEARRWHTWLEDVAPSTESFYYVWDEPEPPVYSEINRRAQLARPIASFVTAHPHERLNVDIFAVLPSDHRGAYASDRVFVYNGIRPFSGTFVIDDAAISPRVNPWIQYKHGIERWFYWEATYYFDFQGGRGAIDVLETADNFRNRHGDVGNGDGLLMYPGPGVGRPLPSIRLHNWRRGVQDVEYLALARGAGHGEWVDELIAVMVPRSLAGETAAGRPVAWSEDGEDWLLARRLIARTISSDTPAEIPDRLRKRQIPRQDATWLAAALLLVIGIVAGIRLRLSRKRL